MKTPNESLVARAIKVKTVLTDQLVPNRHNPRILFDKAPLETLKESIGKVGILVPLTVYQESKTGKYVILDGQRRWLCAKDLKIKTVPVNEVAEPTLVQNIVTMFQIHKLREDWELMPTALKVEVLMHELKEKKESKLASITGLDESVIIRCKRLLSFDRGYQDMMLDPNPDNRLKADFFIELYPVLHDREVIKFAWFKPKKFINQMLKKYREEPRTIRSVTDFRIIKQYITSAKRAGVLSKFSDRLRDFTEDLNVSIEYLEIKEVSQHAGARNIIRKIAGVQSIFENLDTELYYGEDELWTSVVNLIKTLELKLKQADKRR